MTVAAPVNGGFFRGSSYVLRGLKLLSRPRIRLYVIVPFFINAVLFTVGIVYAFAVIDQLLQAWLPDGLDWLKWVIWPLFGLLALGAVFFGFVLLANLLGAPFNGLLSAAVEAVLVERSPQRPTPWTAMPREIAAAMGAEIRKLCFFAGRSIPFLLLFLLIPPLAPFFWFGYCAWALAHEYADYPLDNRGHTFAEQRARLAQNRRLVMGFGAGVMLMTLIPIVNFLAMPAAVAGATIMCLEHFSE